jgi:Tfp pilus assembly protein PilE
MKYLNNNKGIALITSLMITLLSLVIVMGILTVVTQGIKTGASQKVYRNAVEASYGGTNVTMYEIIPQLANAILQNAAPTTANTQATLDSLTNASLFGGTNKINLSFTSTAACLNQKLQSDSSGTNWSSCSNSSTSLKTKDVKNSADISFSLKGTSGSSFNVYSKIVDTIQGTAYMAPPAGGVMVGGGVTESGSGSANLGRHFIYRIEVMGEKATNASEQGNLSVMYEY